MAKKSNTHNFAKQELDIKCSLYESFYPNFKSIINPTRTESIDSDLIIDRNGRSKNKLFGCIQITPKERDI